MWIRGNFIFVVFNLKYIFRVGGIPEISTI